MNKIEHIEDKNKRKLTVNQIDNYISELLNWFEGFDKHYGYLNTTLKAHETIHIILDTILYGKKYNSSTLPFESKGGTSKKIVKGSHNHHHTTAKSIDPKLKKEIFLNITNIKQPIEQNYFNIN